MILSMSGSDGDYAEIYRDNAGEWRSRIKAANHRVIFDSGEGYTEKRDAIAVLGSRFPDVVIVDLDADLEEPGGL